MYFKSKEIIKNFAESVGKNYECVSKIHLSYNEKIDFHNIYINIFINLNTVITIFY